MRYFFVIFLLAGLAGCASTPVYNPMQATAQSELLLNESSLKQVQEGMTTDQVHTIMGQELLIGYAYKSPDYKPLTIPNPYKTEDLKTGGYVVEYYINAIHQPDGTIRNDNLMPLVFKDGKLVGRGWSLVNSLHSPAA